MRILVQTFGSAGDVHPFLALGGGLAARGHEVLVLANEVFGDAVRAAGLGHVGIGTAGEFEAAARNPDLWHPRRGPELVFREGVLPTLEPTVDRIRSLVRPAATVLVGSTLGFAALLAREAFGVPLVMAHLAPSIFRSNHRAPRFAGMWAPDGAPRLWKALLWRLADRFADPLVCPVLNRVRARHGLAPVARVFHGHVHDADLLLGLFPEWFAPRQPDWPPGLRLTGFPLHDRDDTHAPDPSLETWLDAGPPPIVFTGGSANVTAGDFFREAAGAARLLRRRALLVAPDAADVPPDLPAGVRHVRYAPFGRLLPRAAALVAHGGIGTCAQGLAAGIPQLATPRAHDQHDNASRLEDLGVGASLPASRFTAARAASALARLLDDPAVKAACARTARRMAEQDAVAEACDAIETAAGERAATK